MTFLRSITTDFIEKRLWPVVALLGAALVAVVTYVAMSGGGASSSAPGPVATVPAQAGPAVSPAPANPNLAVSETTTGARFQRQAGAHDPFAPLNGASSSTGSGGATGGSSSGTPVGLAKKGAATAGGAATSQSLTTPKTSPPVVLKPPAPAPAPKPAPAPTKTGGSGSGGLSTTHPVEVRFGVVPTTSGPNGTTQQGAPALTDHKDLARLAPLPDGKSPILIYLGVHSDGATATFALAHEAILRGDATCRPSPQNCQLIDLKAGQKETLDYITPSLAIVRYELDVVSVGSQKVASAAAARYFHRESAVGRQLLHADFPPAAGALTYSYNSGSLQPTAAAAAAVARSAAAPVTATGASGSPAYAPPLPHAGPPVVQPGWLGVLLHAL